MLVLLPIALAMSDVVPMRGCHVEKITPKAPAFLRIAAHGTRPGNRCPDCGRASRAVHSRYRCNPADLPSLERRVGVSLRMRRFYRRNANCACRTFAEWLPELVAPHARRTGRRWPRRKPGSAWPWAARPVPGCCATLPCRRAGTRCCACSEGCHCLRRSRRAWSAWTTGPFASDARPAGRSRPGVPP